nr:unnamed protein product [Spirometra erinaceieuropaei]
MDEIGTNLLLQRVTEQAREQRIIRDAALENRFGKLPNPTSPRNDKMVHNLSSKELRKDQMQVLRHEASLDTADAKTVNMIAAVELILCQTEATEETKSVIRQQVSSLLMVHMPRCNNTDRQAHGGPQDTASARFYGLPKAHKDGAPPRPIESFKETPTYGMAKWLFRRRKILTAELDTTVSSSAHFLEKLKGISLHKNEAMDLEFDTIELLLQSKHDETGNRLEHAQILQLLKLCLKTYFAFDGTIYEQVKGTPMGKPILGFIAEAVLQQLGSLLFQHHRPKFWAVFPGIKFTMEEEEENQLAFLDVVVCRKDFGGQKIKVFRKAANTMQILNFNKNHPISHKRSCVRTPYRHVEAHCSEPEDKIAEQQ